MTYYAPGRHKSIHVWPIARLFSDPIALELGLPILEEAPVVLVPFRVLLVTPVASNTLRVYFSIEPRHFSSLSDDDALNRLNYVVSISAGPGTAPVVESVENAQAQPTFDLLFPGAWSVDLRLDRRVLAATTYLTVVASVEAADGTALEPPPLDRDDHPGDAVFRPRRNEQPVSTRGGVDFFYDTFLGAYVLDAKQDVAVHSGLAALKKRIIRRFLTRPGGFFHLPKYGVGLKIKAPIDTTSLSLLSARAEEQVRAEEEVEAASVSIASISEGVILVSIKAKTSSGDLALGLEIDSEGKVFVV